MKKIVLFGSTGQIGWELARHINKSFEILTPSRHEVDFLLPSTVEYYLNEQKPNIIINAAGYTNVDGAEQESEIAKQINSESVGVLATTSQKIGALFVHYSTDYVFDGRKEYPYNERDVPNPINFYGTTKLDGENYIQQIGGKFLILRTSWIYGWRRKNFLTKFLDICKDRKEIPVVTDQIGNPTWCRDVALTTRNILGLREFYGQEISGLYHLASQGITSRHGWAAEIINVLKLDVRLIGITSSEYKSKALRPINSGLDSSLLQTTLNFQIPYWNTSLKIMTTQYNFT